ncbi:RIP metalloprotease RseP [Hydromonas duriensis]|uniref:Zinc metalloprotease n=1 Tax=Hydromonas duriensis TaxID=1527608 RepID=A0A4R6Y8G2_9BURK|nr:RIP metalloprotease RseP [Hydromonas duriensis]TDR31683.1 regulator of sigma E protease [Hydromonas duriensis]
MNSLWSFIVAILVLVTIHEWGHYWVAKKCGVDIEKFSIGFGKPLFTWKNKEGTEFCLAMIPLGGYVKMRGEYAITTAEEQAAQPKGSFAACNVWQRMAIVVAGPLVNLLFAFLIFTVFSYGTQHVIAPVAQAPVTQTLAAPLGIQTGDVITEINQKPVVSWNDVNVAVSRSVFNQTAIDLTWRGVDGVVHQGTLNTAGISIEDPAWLDAIGLYPEETQPRLGRVMPHSVAEAAGLQDGDEVTHIDGVAIYGATALREAITQNPNKYIALTVNRNGKSLNIDVKPAAVETKVKANGTEEVKTIGRIGVAISGFNSIQIHQGMLTALEKGVKATWDSTVMTFQGMFKMLTGQLSLKNIGGPVSIAQMAGESSTAGWVTFVGFLAMLSVSLGALNLLPIPMLDGGHLVYYVIEVFTGKPVSEKILAVGQRVGLTFLLCLMGIAFYNDALKLFG